MYALSLYEKLGVDSSVAIEILSIALMMIAGFLMTRITKLLKLPNVTAYILAGILLGPYCFDLIPPTIVSGTDFLPDIALAFIAFGTGEFFRMESLKKYGFRVIWITVMEACTATLLVFILCYGVFGLPLPFSAVLGALAAATAPASTMMTIRQTHAKGEFVDILLQVVAFDDIVGLVAYSVSISIATAFMQEGHIDALNLIFPILNNVAMLLLGGLFGALTVLVMKRRHTTDNRLIISVTMLMLFCGICAILEISPLLGCMAMGTVYINMTDDERLFRQLGYFSPPILMLFFVRSGISFDIGSLFVRTASFGGYSLLLIGIGYFLTRIIGKYCGAFLGGIFVKAKKEVRNYLGLALIPQAGVAIGLAELGARTLGGETGKSLQTIILASSVLYELIGPACAKASLYLSHSYAEDELRESGEGEETETTKNAVDLLVDQIMKIQTEIALEEEIDSRDERIFSEEAEKLYLEEGGELRAKKKKKKERDKKT